MDLLDYSDEIYLDRNEYGNHLYYKDKDDNFYDIYGAIPIRKWRCFWSCSTFSIICAIYNAY